LNRLLARSGVVELLRPQRGFGREFGGPVRVAFSVVGEELLVGQFSNVSHWVTSPDLPCRDERSGLHDGVREDLAASFESGSLLNDGVMANYHIVVDDAGVDVAISADRNVFSNIAGGSDSVVQRVVGVDCRSISDRSEMADSYRVYFGPDCDPVPNC
jgi:hypothetical protein